MTEIIHTIISTLTSLKITVLALCRRDNDLAKADIAMKIMMNEIKKESFELSRRMYKSFKEKDIGTKNHKHKSAYIFKRFDLQATKRICFFPIVGLRDLKLEMAQILKRMFNFDVAEEDVESTDSECKKAFSI